MSYTKPHLTFEEQLELLRHRGLAVSDEAAALRYLRTVGYYALGGYLYTMRELRTGPSSPTKRGHQERLDTFLRDASFDHAIELYEFDRRLRHLCLEALDVIERAIKARIAYNIGQVDPFGHHNGSVINPSARSRHAVWLDKHNRKVRERSGEGIRKFVVKYGPQLPLWVAVEAMDFGDTDHLLGLLNPSLQTSVAKAFDLLSGPQMVSWTRTMCMVRNICAHHERLWNRKLIDTPMRPKGKEGARFTELQPASADWSKPYAALLVISHFVDRIDRAGDWSRMGQLLQSLPVGPGVNHAAIGAPSGWRNNPAWGLDG